MTPLLATLAATQPAWWSSGDHPILNDHPANNLGTANLGQAKHMAASAIEALREVAPVVAGNIEADLAGTVDLTVPNPQTPEWLARQQGALVLGQLKALATPFYDRLHSVAPEWLEQQRAAVGSQHTGTHLPWTPDTADDANTSPANIGQLKAVFTLDFATLPAASLDSDGDDMPDAWEMANGLNANDPADANEDPDGDGLTNAQEHAIEGNPNVAENPGIAQDAIRNGDFTEPAILGGGLETTHGATGWNYWAGIPGWTAVEGENIELQNLEPDGSGNPYVELKAHPAGHYGIKQTIGTRKGISYLVIFRCKPRGDVPAQNSNMEVKVNGANIKSVTFMDDLEWQTYYATFKADRVISELSFVPSVTPNDTLGCLVDGVSLLPVELNMDIDNDGEIGGGDSGLAQKAFESGATEEDIEKGTEFLFANDQLSNGLWDGEDSDPDKPAAEKDDDDAQQIKIDPGITEGDVWLEHPAIAGLSFYKTRECKPGDKIDLSPSSKFTISDQNPFPEEIFVRADNVSFPDANNPQVEGNLVLKIKVGDQEIEATKIKLTVVKEFGAKKYFHAARDYILENNTRFHVKDAEYEDDRFGWADSHFRVVSMRESATTLYPIDASRRTGGIPLRGIDATAGAFPGISVAINGNISYFSNDDYNSTASRLLVPGAQNLITDKCHGRMVRFGALDTAVSSDNDVLTTSPAGSDLAGPDGKFLLVNQGNAFAFGKGRVPLNPVPGLALGGNSTNYNSQDRDGKPYQIFGRCSLEHQSDDNVMVFTATHLQPPGNGFLGKVDEFVEDAKSSGVKALPGGSPGDVEVLLLDGGSSVGLGYTNPDEVMTIQIKGGKHTGQLPFYYINTYLLFRCEKAR